MIVCRDRQIAFVHIPKTAGSSLTRVMSPFIDVRDRAESARTSGPGWQADWHLGGLQHSSLADGLGQMRQHGLDPSDFRFFSVARCPFTWIRSIFENFYWREIERGIVPDLRFFVGRQIRRRKGTLSPLDRFRMDRPGGVLGDFLEFLDENWDASWTSHGGAWGFRGQSSWLETEEDVTMEIVGHFENLDAVWDWLWSVLDLEPDAEAPHLLDRRTEQMGFLAQLEPAHLDIVRRRFSVDFERFAYPLDPDACGV
ncbi:MAG: sulfotransferase family 2 domain-containing protein [Longimicrobiales bacterium]